MTISVPRRARAVSVVTAEYRLPFNYLTLPAPLNSEAQKTNVYAANISSDLVIEIDGPEARASLNESVLNAAELVNAASVVGRPKVLHRVPRHLSRETCQIYPGPELNRITGPHLPRVLVDRVRPCFPVNRFRTRRNDLSQFSKYSHARECTRALPERP